MNLGGMIRGIVQADVGGGIKNYQAKTKNFFKNIFKLLIF